MKEWKRLTAVELEHGEHGEVVQQAAVQEQRDQRREAALAGRRARLGAVGVQLAQNFTRTHDKVLTLYCCRLIREQGSSFI